MSGYAVEIAEILAGVALIGGPLIWLLAWPRVSDRVRLIVLLVAAVATIGGAFLAVNLHLANAGVIRDCCHSTPTMKGSTSIASCRQFKSSSQPSASSFQAPPQRVG
jgi:hypothetical protein